ncbi:MAG: DHHA1 domain-containing protein [Candidatus Aenigmatarchaeota archaeon]
MKTIILTHADCDGICAGAIVKSRFPQAEIFFTKPVSFYDDLNSCEAERLIICDIAISRKDFSDIIKLFEQKSKNSEIFYFDHHPLPEDVFKKIQKTISVYWNQNCSSSELVYRYFQKNLPPERVWIAIYGAIGDYEEKTEFVEHWMKNWDVRALYFQASILFLGIKDENFDDYDSKRMIAKYLAEGKNPSDIPGLVEAAKKIAKEEFTLYEIVKKNAKKADDIGYIKDIHSFGFRGPSALFSATVTQSRVGISVYTRKNHLDLTLRSVDDSIPLNLLAEEAAERVGGSGGGHLHAAGARIPLDKLDDFIKQLNDILKTKRKS